MLHFVWWSWHTYCPCCACICHTSEPCVYGISAALHSLCPGRPNNSRAGFVKAITSRVIYLCIIICGVTYRNVSCSQHLQNHIHHLTVWWTLIILISQLQLAGIDVCASALTQVFLLFYKSQFQNTAFHFLGSKQIVFLFIYVPAGRSNLNWNTITDLTWSNQLQGHKTFS